MRTLKFILTYFLSGLLIVGCKNYDKSPVALSDKYPNDSIISNQNGISRDSLTFYYPTNFIGDTIRYRDTLNDFYQNWFSSSLYAFKEPILYNYYLGHDIYRFLWLRSFDRPIVFILNRYNNNVWLIVKILDKQPQFIDQTILKALPIKGKGLKVELVPDSVIKGDRKANIVLEKRINITSSEWNKLDSLLKVANYWTIPPVKDATGTDGSQWIIETHKIENYRFVQRWTPKDKFRDIGVYFIELSGLKEEIY